MATLIIFLCVMFFFGGMMLILGAGIKSIEEERAKEATRSFDPLDSSHFFMRPISDKPRPPAHPVDDTLVIEIERFLRDEMDVANRFVSEPSVENLYQRVYQVASHN